MIYSAACGSGSTALPTERVERRLAAILAADIAGYSRLIGADEEGTLAQVKAHRCELINPKISEHRGRIVKTAGGRHFDRVLERYRGGLLRGCLAARDGRTQCRDTGARADRLPGRFEPRRRHCRG